MEKVNQTEINEVKARLRENDGNRPSLMSSIVSKEDIHVGEEDKYDAHSSLFANKIKEAFLNSNVDIYLFANPYSGSREASAYTNLPLENYRFTLEGENEVFLRIVNITIREKVEIGKEYIKNSIETKFNTNINDDKPIKMTEYGKKVIVVICGGDGTFMNIVQEFKEDGIDIDKIAFTQFPFGTANDVANAFRWGRTPPKQMLNNLFRVCTELIEATEDKFNIWEVSFTVRERDGDIFIPGGRHIKSLCTKKITRIMCHSFSFGADARVGLAFELKRTKNRH